MPSFSQWMYIAILLFARPVIAQSPWDGTWKLDKSTVHVVPPALSIEMAGPRYALKQGPTFRFDCDGNDFPGSGFSVRCAPLSHGIKLELTRNGKLASTWELELHADGVTMTETVSDVHEGVPPSIEHNEYRRPASGDTSLTGTWTGVRTIIEGSDALEMRIHDGFLYFRDARDGEASEAKLDGTSGKFIGPDVPPGITWSNVLENERRIVGHALKDGKQLNTEVFELSEDGRSIKASQPGSPNQYEAVYVKQ